MKYNITRKAIIVGAPGGVHTKHLPGVQADLKAFAEFLCSARGGSWYDYEMSVLDDPTAEELLCAAQSAYADYLFIYFSGHGYTDAGSGSRMLCCRNGSVADISLLQGRSPRMFLTTDVCRTLLEESIGSIPLSSADYFDFTGDQSVVREIFDQAIMVSPSGKTILHSTQLGLKASDSREGGVFTQTLLHVCSHMIIEKGLQVVNIEQILFHVPDVLAKRGNSQQPDLIRLSGNLNVPFAVAMPAPKVVEAQPYYGEIGHADSGEGGLLLALGLLIFAALAIKT